MSLIQEIDGICKDLEKKYGKDIVRQMGEFCDLPENKELVWKSGFSVLSEEEIKNKFESPEDAFKKAKDRFEGYCRDLNKKPDYKKAYLDSFSNWINSEYAVLESSEHHFANKVERIGLSELLYDSNLYPFSRFLKWASINHPSKAFDKELEDKRYFSSQGHTILKHFIDQEDNRVHVIGTRVNPEDGHTTHDYFVGLGYDFKDGCWGQGRYDFVKAEDAIESLKNDYKVRELSPFEIEDIEVNKMKNTKKILMNKQGEPKVPPIKEEKQTCLGRVVLKRYSTKNKEGLIRDHMTLESKVKGYFFDVSQEPPVKGKKEKPYLVRLVSKKGLHEVWFTSKEKVTARDLGKGESVCIKEIEKFKEKNKALNKSEKEQEPENIKAKDFEIGDDE